jgi:hypothetical protein
MSSDKHAERASRATLLMSTWNGAARIPSQTTEPGWKIQASGRYYNKTNNCSLSSSNGCTVTFLITYLTSFWDSVVVLPELVSGVKWYSENTRVLLKGAMAKF